MTTTTAAPRPPSRTSALAVVTFLILICSPCLGLGGGLAYLSGQRAGQFARWRTLAAPPETAVNFVAADPFRVYVSTLSGQVYLCDHNQNPVDADCWLLAEEPYAIATDTDFEHAVFSGEPPPPPGEATDLVFVSIFGAEYAVEARYALLTDGTVWVWEYGADSNQSLIVLLSGPVLGLALGVVVILALLVLNTTRRRARAAAG